MSTVLTVVNQKGGVGKTTTCVNLGIGLLRQDKKVLLIDADAGCMGEQQRVFCVATSPQGSLTTSLGFRKPDEIPTTLSTIMGKILNEIPPEPSEGILRHEEGVDLLPANMELSGVELSLVNIMSREAVLRQYIDTIKPLYDYIIINCMPSLGMMTINRNRMKCPARKARFSRSEKFRAIAAADSIITPVQAQYLPVKGLEQLLKSVAKIKKKINPALSIAGILITMPGRSASRNCSAKRPGSTTGQTTPKTLYQQSSRLTTGNFIFSVKIFRFPSARLKPVSRVKVFMRTIQRGARRQPTNL